MLCFTELIQNSCRFQALTGYTVDEFRALLSFFTVRFQDYVSHFTLEGRPRQNRAYSTYKNSTFPTMEDKLLFILNYMKTYPIQQTQAQLFGIQQSQANQWIHLLSPLVKQALADCGEFPLEKRRTCIWMKTEPVSLFMIVLSVLSIGLKTPKNSIFIIAASRRNIP